MVISSQLERQNEVLRIVDIGGLVLKFELKWPSSSSDAQCDVTL